VAVSSPARSMSVWERLKEHKVAQWTLAYAAAGYALLHGTEMVSNALEWPHVALPEILGEHLFMNIADDTRFKAFLRKNESTRVRV
jgi:hypothetical protein